MCDVVRQGYVKMHLKFFMCFTYPHRRIVLLEQICVRLCVMVKYMILVRVRVVLMTTKGISSNFISSAQVFVKNGAVAIIFLEKLFSNLFWLLL